MCLSVPMSHSLWQPQSVSDAASQRRNIRARMSMTPYAIQNSIQELQALRAMDVDYYTLSPPYSSSFLSQSSASSSVLEQNNYVHIDKIIAEVVDLIPSLWRTEFIRQANRRRQRHTRDIHRDYAVRNNDNGRHVHKDRDYINARASYLSSPIGDIIVGAYTYCDKHPINHIISLQVAYL